MKRFKAMSRTKKLVAVGLSVGLTLGIAGAAFAFFTSTATGSGTGAVGSNAAWTVNNPSPTGSLVIYPGVGSQTFAFTVTNSGGGNQGLSSVAVSVAPDATAAGKGCVASWYDVNVDGLGATPASYTENYSPVVDLAPGQDQPVSVVLTMPDNTTTNQDACEGDAPVVTLQAS